jgi:hypothetical protein
MRERKGQEEIVGFVAVVVLVSVVALIFITLSLRGGGDVVVNDESVREALEGALQYTSDCSVPGTQGYASLGDLFQPCMEQSVCEDGRSSCDVLNSNLDDLLTLGLRVGPDRPYKGFTFSASRSASNSSEAPEMILELQKGNCTGYSRQGTNEFRPTRQSGIIRLELGICN